MKRPLKRPAPGRPVLVATVRYAAETPERSFVGTIRPRIETDMGFRVPGKVAQAPGRGRPDRRYRPAAGHPRRGRSEAAGRAVGGRIPRRHRRAGAGERLRAARQGSARQGLDHRRADGSEPRRRRRGAGAPQSCRAVGRTHQELSLLCNAAGRQPRRRHRDPDRSRPGRGLRPDRDPRRALCREGSRGRDPRDAGRPRQVRHSQRDAVVGRGQESMPRSCARSRPRPIRRRGPILQNSRCRKPTTRSRSA